MNRITVRLSNAQCGALRRESAATGLPQTEVIRRALSERAVLAEIERAVAARVTAVLEPVTERIAAQHIALEALGRQVENITLRVHECATRNDLIQATNFLADRNRAGGAT